jgi:hypothetical protein
MAMKNPSKSIVNILKRKPPEKYFLANWSSIKTVQLFEHYRFNILKTNPTYKVWFPLSRAGTTILFKKDEVGEMHVSYSGAGIAPD